MVGVECISYDRSSFIISYQYIHLACTPSTVRSGKSAISKQSKLVRSQFKPVRHYFYLVPNTSKIIITSFKLVLTSFVTRPSDGIPFSDSSDRSQFVLLAVVSAPSASAILSWFEGHTKSQRGLAIPHSRSTL